jgi:beta-barrel assembly-enhancing protease
MSAYTHIIAVGIGLLPLASYGAVPKQADINAYRALIVQDVRLATAGYRIASANAAFCPRTERNPGWVIHDIAQYPDADTAKAAFGFDMPVHVAAVVAGSPADSAQIHAGDGFRGLADANLYWLAMPLGKTGYERMASFKQLLAEKLGHTARLPVQLTRAGKPFATTLSPPLVCASDFQIDTKGGMDAGADGKMVSVTLSLVTYAKDDNALAAVVAHEMAHNILAHPAKLKAAGIRRGIAGQFGKSKDAVRAAETEADKLSVWLLGNAGYDVGAAIVFLQKLGAKMPSLDRTHYPWKVRVKIMREEMQIYDRAPKIQGKAVPPLLVQ